jgi:hypothetical protein
VAQQAARHEKDSARALLRHTVATLAYRSAKVLRDAHVEFAEFRVGPASRTPLQILAHMGDLFDWALTMAQDRTTWHSSVPQEWRTEVVRFYAVLTEFDQYLASAAPLSEGVAERLFQGAVADALTHTGQLSLLRRLSGQPVRGESYARADIVAGSTGLEQAAARWEFD